MRLLKYGTSIVKDEATATANPNKSFFFREEQINLYIPINNLFQLIHIVRRRTAKTSPNPSHGMIGHPGFDHNIPRA